MGLTAGDLAADQPIFLFGASQRTGTTLVQRLLNSHPDVFVWGEHGGALDHILDARETLSQWQKSNGAAALWEVKRFGLGGFVANLSPSETASDEAFRLFLAAMFGADHEGTPRTRWGFKEVRYDATAALRLLELFPQGRVVFLVRDVVSVAKSLASWQSDPDMAWKDEWTKQALTTWVRNINSFRHVVDERVCIVKLESLLASPGPELGGLCSFLELESSGLSHSVLAQKIHAPGAKGRDCRVLPEVDSLDSAVLDFLRSDSVVELRREFGYD